MWASSVRAVRKNFFRAGVLPKRFLTSMTVPAAVPVSWTLVIEPKALKAAVPSWSSFLLETMLIFDTEAIEGMASPLKPRLVTEKTVSSLVIFEVP